jgi:hypothetical protein
VNKRKHIRKLVAIGIALATAILTNQGTFSQKNTAPNVHSTDETHHTTPATVSGAQWVQLEPAQLAAYIKEHHDLPEYFITKKEASKLGWRPGKSVWDTLPGRVIGGDVFTNRQRIVPVLKGRTWREADVHYDGKRRGPERIVFSNDDLVFYTKDHYQTFTEL